MRVGDDYPGQQNPYPAPQDFRPGQQDLRPEWPTGQPARQDRPANRVRPTWKPGWPTWWIAPFLGGAFAVLAVTAVLQVTVFRHQSGTPSAASSPAPAAPIPVQVFPDALFNKLTQDIQDRNEAGFLSLVSPAARPAVQVWWENMQAIGFTTGLVMPTASNDKVNLDSHGDGTATVLAGTHNALDPVDRNNKPEIPCERYQIGLHFTSGTAIGQITSWKSVGDDPWDQGGRLYVRKAANVVVAGPAADSGLVDETLPIAQAAASYDVGLVSHVNAGDLHQQGFVVFVSSNSAARDGWFTTGPQLAQWPPTFFGGLTASLPGPGVSADTAFNNGKVSDGSTGGARVVITPYEDQNGGSASLETKQLVNHFMLDILAADDQALYSGLQQPSVPSWSVEGLAVAAQDLYAENTNPALGTYSFNALQDAKALPASYRAGSVPTSQQLFTGSMATEENWNDVAASVYEYIADKYGMNQMFAAASLLWLQNTTPFGNVLASSSNGNYTFYTAGTIQSGWQAALAGS